MGIPRILACIPGSMTGELGIIFPFFFLITFNHFTHQVIDSFSWNIKLLSGQANLLNTAKQHCEDCMKQVNLWRFVWFLMLNWHFRRDSLLFNHLATQNYPELTLRFWKNWSVKVYHVLFWEVKRACFLLSMRIPYYSKPCFRGNTFIIHNSCPSMPGSIQLF